MKKRTARENLKSFSWIYIICLAILVVGVIVGNVMPDMTKKMLDNQKDAILILNVTAVVYALIYLWYFWLARRAADGKSAGTVYMILLILGVAASFATAISTKSVAAITSFDFIVDVLGLYFLLKVRND